jgi:hypothetical protein
MVTRKLIADIVSRARSGDQIACALLSETTSRAKRGDPRSIKNYKKFVKYMRKNPPIPRYASFGREEKWCDNLWLRACIQGRKLADRFYLQCSRRGAPNPRVSKIASSFEGEEEELFIDAVTSRKPAHLYSRAGFAGSALSYAIRLQKVRLGGPLSLLSQQAQNELS